METRLHSKFVHSAFAAGILSVLSGGAGAQAPPWSLTGNAGTDPLTNFLGTRDGKPLVIQPGTGNVGIGTTTPEDKLTVVNGRIMFANTELSKAGRMGVDELGVWIEPVGTTSGIRLNASEHAFGLYVADSGNVGIGTLGPGAKLVLDRGFNESRDTPSLLIRHNGDSPISPAFILQNDQGGEINQVFLFGQNSDPGGLGPSHEAGRIIANWHGLTIKSGKGVIIDGSFQASGCCAGDFNGDVYVHGKTVTQVLEITGGSDLAEPFAVDQESTIQAGMVVAIDPTHPGQLRLADHAYDRTVAGIVSGANGIKPGLTMTSDHTAAGHSQPVALSGRAYVWADGTHDPIQPGDLLTTADNPGHAMKVTDYARAQGAILGKAMSALPAGKGLILVLVSLQ
jgi:hypothetical protein